MTCPRVFHILLIGPRGVEGTVRLWASYSIEGVAHMRGQTIGLMGPIALLSGSLDPMVGLNLSRFHFLFLILRKLK